MKAAIYARVSTDDQNAGMQLTDLREFAKQRGFEIYQEYCDVGISGSKDSRPQLNELMDEAHKGKIHAVLVWKFDRFARSTKHLVNALDEFNHLGIHFISYTENIDTSSPTGKVLFAIVSAMAEFERDLIRERVKAGLEHAKKSGVKLGRPSLVTEELQEQMQEMRTEGHSFRKIAKKVGVSPALVYKTLSNSSNRNQGRATFSEGT